MTEEKKPDVYHAITARIIAAIETGAGAFQMPWHRGGTARPRNACTGKAYRGVNVLALWAAAAAAGYWSGHWASYKQWGKLGAQVRRGEKASIIVFYKELERDVEDENGETEIKTIRVARASYVFSAEQVDGWEAPMPAVRSTAEILERAEAFIAATGAVIRHGGDRACYLPAADEIRTPRWEQFVGSATSTATESYYATLLHELTHWTGHKSRLDRDLSGRFGNHAYAMEELVAELGAAFLCADLEVTNVPRDDHAAYIASWLEVLKRDTKAVFTAAGKAAQAANYLFGFQSEEVRQGQGAEHPVPVHARGVGA